ncbi:SIN3-HDAC complex-associated factor [Copidosoma floridanum]|uniref:SIN3-HDAC complex-associated factor n=1 Tax=Copidosoma floridanum TaxID=29053 RepID=UPI0006C9CB8D|nr:SIN3-HDAC complex-associated factor [Copidosoma floridanum]
MNDTRKRRKVAKAKMFNFHKPKVYRSSTGCCICKAKSSSSRFTDSRKYEEDFMKCFKLQERRTGEICNACVLLVKRWKKLPVSSGRDWHHVVDARAGPGIKASKFKAKNKKCPIVKKKKKHEDDSDDSAEENAAGNGSKNSSRAGSPASSDENGDKRLDHDPGDAHVSDFIDTTYFTRKKICCGVIYVGRCGEVMIEASLFKPCLSCLARRQQQHQQQLLERAALATSTAGSSPDHSSASASPCHSSASASPAHSLDSIVSGDSKSSAKGFLCDSSSDSGYDDFSNPGDSKKLQLLLQAPAPSMSHLTIGKPVVKPVAKPHQQIKLMEPMVTTTTTTTTTSVAGATALRFRGLKSTKVPIKLLCKPVALVSSAKLSLAGGGPVMPDSVLTVVPPAVDFARSPSQRPSLAN